MLRHTIRSLWARKARLALSTLAIALGVGAVAGTFVLTDSARSALERAATDRAGDAEEDLDFIRTLLSAAGGLALLVGGLVVHNTFSITVAQRTRDLALLRCLGASRRQLRRSVVVEALLVGGTVSLLGLVAGLGLAFVLRAWLEATGEHLPIGGLVLSPRTVALAFGLGVAITVVSGLGPARRASRVAPVAALRRDAAGLDPATGAPRIALGGALCAAAGAALSFGVATGASGPGPYLGGGALALLGVVALGPVLAGPLARTLGWPAGRALGLPGRLARENAARDPRRTATTAAALMIGLALLSLLAVLASSTRTSVAARFDRVYLADVELRGPEQLDLAAGTYRRQAIDPAIVDRLEDLPELATVVPLLSGAGTVGEERVGVSAAEPVEVGEVFGLDVVAGRLTDLSDGTIGVSASAARAHGWTVGSPVPLDLGDGDVAGGAAAGRGLTVGAIYADDEDVFGVPLSTVGDYLLAPDDYRRASGDRTGAGEIYVRAAAGVAGPEAEAAVERAVGGDSRVEVLDRAELRHDKLGQMQEAVRTYSGLLGLVVVVALFGVVNTMALSVVERVRELGLLRAVGMDRAQVRSMIRWESVIVAAIGAALGVGLGTLLGWSVVRSFRDSGLGVFSVPLAQLALLVALVSLLGTAAADLPARQAARTDILDALALE